jgi:transforming growth factor-beta-induced protein
VRKLTTLFTLLALAIVAVVPAFAQDEAPATLADAVIAFTEGEEPEFTVLLAAVLAADPAVLELLSDPEAEVTVFAPTDQAFMDAIEALGQEAFDALLADQEALTSVLLYHVVDGAVFAEDVVALEDGTEVPTLLEDASITVSFGEEGEVFVNESQVVTTDVAVGNSVVHVIDAVLLPPAGDDMDDMMEATEEPMMEEELVTIAELVIEAAGAEEDAQFTTLLAAVLAADEAVVTLLSDPEAEVTVFAPTDEAFEALIEALGEEAFGAILEDQEALTNILLYHVVDGAVDSETVVGLEDGTEVPTLLEGANITVTFGEEGEVFVNDSQVIIVDVMASNGIIHVIDAVLVPAADE